MSDPALALQGAIVAALKAANVAGARVYDAIPKTAEFPYVTLGDDQVLGDDIDCAELSEITVRLHGWSRAVGYPELKAVTAAIRTVFREAVFALDGFTVHEVRFLQAQYLQDPDGQTRHAVLEFEFFISHA